MNHAKLSPSSSSRWSTCTASVKASEQYENKTNSAAEFGTAIHGIGELLLLDKPIPDIVEGMKVTEEMMDCAEEYVDYCRSLMTPKSVTMVEERFDLTFLAPEMFGTGDFTVLNDTHLHIVDLKTGHNIVSAEENTQLMLYALGAIEELEGLGYDIEDVTLHIVQTRANHISTWDTTNADLFEFRNKIQVIAKNIYEDKVEFNPNAKACKWCPHQVNCEALRVHTENIIKGAFDELEDIEGQANNIDTKHIKKILDNADLIEGFIKAVKEVALERMQEGVEIDGYKLVESRTNRKWKDEEQVAEYLKKKKIRVEDIYNKKLKSMTQILKLRPKDAELEAMLYKPEGAAIIAPLSDKRPPLRKVCDDFDTL